LDPDNHKSILDIQNESLAAKNDSRKGKRKASEAISDDSDAGESDGADISMDVDLDHSALDEDAEVVPMAPSEGIGALREKLHRRMLELRMRGRPAESGDKDDLLEERRRQRAAMRERRRKETKEKIQREQELKGKKTKDKKEEKEKRDKGNSTKVRRYVGLK